MKTYTTSKIITFIASTALMASLIVVPTLAFAKDNENSNNGKGNEKKETHCFRAFGHLIAPGWIKNNSQLALSDECNLPFGIGKKFKGNNSTTTPVVDTVAPVIRSAHISPRIQEAVVRWATNEKSDSTVFYSLSSLVDINSSGTLSVSRTALVKDHQLVIGSLTASTTYYAIVRSRDARGNTSTSSVMSFTTKSPQSTNDTVAPIISSIVSVTGTTSIQIGWTTNEFATSRVYYSASGTVDANATTTTFVEKASLDKNHVIVVPYLTASTTYFFIVESSDAAGNISKSPVFSVKTGTTPVVVDATAPIMNNAVAIIGSTTVQLSWSTNENSTSKAYFGTTSPVNVSVGTTASVENISLVTAHTLSVSSLSTSTQYYMVLESKDASNNIVRSGEFTFTTTTGI